MKLTEVQLRQIVREEITSFTSETGDESREILREYDNVMREFPRFKKYVSYPEFERRALEIMDSGGYSGRGRTFNAKSLIVKMVHDNI